jgi:hypothetical protein
VAGDPSGQRTVEDAEAKTAQQAAEVLPAGDDRGHIDDFRLFQVSEQAFAAERSAYCMVWQTVATARMDGEQERLSTLGGDGVSLPRVFLFRDWRRVRPICTNESNRRMIIVRYCRDCNQKTWHRRSEPDGIPYPRSWSWILLAPVIWIANLVADLVVNR